jgi:hypothetical protein
MTSPKSPIPFSPRKNKEITTSMKTAPVSGCILDVFQTIECEEVPNSILHRIQAPPGELTFQFFIEHASILLGKTHQGSCQWIKHQASETERVK